MEKRQLKEKNIAEGTNDNVNVFVPFKSVGPILLDSDIENYLNLPHFVKRIQVGGGLDPNDEVFVVDYYFPDYGLSASCYENSKIITGVDVRIPAGNCITWEGHNLIGMSLRTFQKTYSVEITSDEVFYMPGHMRKQHCYTIDSVGLLIWTWRGKIITVQVMHYIPD